MKIKSSILPGERIEQRTYLIREQRVMLSPHLAELYGVAPKVLVQQVKRNIERFPKDFMFQLTRTEFENLKSQIVTSSWEIKLRVVIVTALLCRYNVRRLIWSRCENKIIHSSQ